MSRIRIVTLWMETPRGLAVRGAQLLINSLNSFAFDEASLHIPVRAPENKVFVISDDNTEEKYIYKIGSSVYFVHKCK